MNRLVRISLTLFASATIMIVLVFMRLNEAAAMTSDVAKEQAAQMSYVGIGIAGVLLLSGMAVLATAFMRSRRVPANG